MSEISEAIIISAILLLFLGAVCQTFNEFECDGKKCVRIQNKEQRTLKNQPDLYVNYPKPPEKEND
jgi:hypothetical protein